VSIKIALDARLVAGANTGDSTYWTGLLEGFAKIPGDFELNLISNGPRPADIPWCDRFIWRHAPAKSNRVWSLFTFPSVAKQLGAQVLHTQYSVSPLTKIPAVTTVHDVSFFIGPEWFPPRDRTLLRATIPSSCRRAARVITVSETSRAEIEQFVPSARGKTVVTPNACPSWIVAVPKEVARARVAAELGVAGPFVLTVGTRWPRKNMELAIDAVSGLPDSYPHQILVTGKTGWGSQELGKRGKATGYVDSELLSCLYSAADLYLAPSRHEGFGIPVLEAFRCGCPVLCSSGGALPEVAGDAALVERSWEAADWTDTIQRLLDDPGTLETLRKRGLDRESTFTWEETARRTLDVYREVAK